MTDEPALAARVLLALDAGAAEEEPVSLALQLAAAMHAELSGLLVHDARLLSAARLPFAREVGLASACVQPLGGADLEHILKRRAERIRHFVESEAARSRIPVSFRVAHGDLGDELGAALHRAELVVAASRRRIVARLGAAHAPARRAETVSVLFDSSSAGLRALQAALDLVGAQPQRLSVLLTAPLHAHALDSLLQAAQHGSRAARIVAVDVSRGETITRQVQRDRSRALVLCAQSMPQAAVQLPALLATLPCPLVLVP